MTAAAAAKSERIPEDRPAGPACVGGGGCVCRHWLTGAPPDYHWVGANGEYPRWTKYEKGLKAGADPRLWWYRVEEIAQQTGYSRETIRRALRTGDLKASKTPTGRVWFVRGDDLEAFMKGQGRLAPVAG